MIAILTIDLERDERMGWRTYQVRVNGLDVMGITEETGEEAVERFKAIAEKHAAELLVAVRAVNERREWNIAHEGQGRNWPAFGRLDALKAKLLKEAGIRDT